MVILSCNGIDIREEADMQRAIAESGGILKMLIQLEDGRQAEGLVEMIPVSQVAF